MARSARVTVTHGSTPNRLDTDETHDAVPGNTLVMRNSGTVDAFIGGDNVTTANGLTLLVDAILVLDINEHLYAVVDGSTDGEIEVLRVL